MSTPHCICPAFTVSAIIFLDSLVSVPITHFFDFIRTEKLFENFKTSFNIRSFPKIPLMPEMDIFTVSHPERLFINSDKNRFVPR